MERHRLPGLAIALVRDGAIVWSRAYGYADLASNAPATPSTVFAIQSVTKPIVSTALMQWYERGAFTLDDAANTHLAPLRIESEVCDPGAITVRHLFTHTSGLPVDVELAPPGAEGPQPLEAYLTRVARAVRPPGTDVVYANWGYDLLGVMIQRFAGEPYDAYLRARVLEPLDMRSTDVRPGEGLATGYYLSALDGGYHDPGGQFAEPATVPPRPAGALFSTAEDLARFLIMQLAGGTYEGRCVLRPETVSEMQRLQAQAGPLDDGMGLGFRVTRHDGRRLICHGGDGVTFTACIAAYPEERAGVALLINLGRAQTARAEIVSAALRTLTGAPLQARAPSGVLPEGFAGRYLSNFWGIEAAVDDRGGAPAITFEGGIVTTERGEPSGLDIEGEGHACGAGGPLDGLQVALVPAHNGGPAQIYGGLYTFRFERTDDLPPPEPVDERADLTGTWAGTIASPLGPVPVTLRIESASSAAVTALSASDAAVEEFEAARGRVAGAFDVSLPGFGDFRVFLRLVATSRGLAGRIYARGGFGEVPMRAELTSP